MKAFYSPVSEPAWVDGRRFSNTSRQSSPDMAERIPPSARIAVYDSPASAPRVEEVGSTEPGQYIESLATRIYELARERGGSVPYTVVRELSENFIHADFAEPVVSILDEGNTIRFADQGPGIADKERALLPGFTTARGTMKCYIRGVGSGFPIVSEFLSVTGGRLYIEDNLGCGAVVTVSANRPLAHGADEVSVIATNRQPLPTYDESPRAREDVEVLTLELGESGPSPRLSTRQKHVLALVLESGEAGPSLVSRELGVGLSTAYRDLASLEDLGLIESTGGKRALTDQGMKYFEEAV